jgi:hypothetical protein
MILKKFLIFNMIMFKLRYFKIEFYNFLKIQYRFIRYIYNKDKKISIEISI